MMESLALVIAGTLVADLESGRIGKINYDLICATVAEHTKKLDLSRIEKDQLANRVLRHTIQAYAFHV